MRVKSWVITFSLALVGSASMLSGQTATEHAHAKAAPSTELRLTVDGKTSTITMADLAAMPQKTITVHNEHTKKDESYTGVALGDLLAKYGFAVGRRLIARCCTATSSRRVRTSIGCFIQ